MNDRLKAILIGFVFIILFASIMLSAAVYSEGLEKGTRDIKCYDRNNNEIYELICEEEYFLDEDKQLISGIIGLGAMACFFMSVILTLVFAVVSKGDGQ